MTNSIDNSIRLGMRQNRDDFIIAAVLIIGLGLSAGAFAPLLFAMVAAGIVFEVRACKRVFYDSVYGRQGYFYMMLPVDVRQLVISKLYTASVLSAGIIAMLVIGGVFYFWTSFNSVTIFEIMDQLTAQLVLIVKMELVYAVPITLISWIIGIVAQMTVVFTAIVCYSSLPEKKHTGLCKALTIIAGAAAVLYAVRPASALIGFGVLESSILLAIAEAVFQIIVTAALYRYIVRALEKYYMVI